MSQLQRRQARISSISEGYQDAAYDEIQELYVEIRA